MGDGIVSGSLYCDPLIPHANGARDRPSGVLREQCSLVEPGGFSPIVHFNKQRAPWALCLLERVMGIEPTFLAWEANVLPLNYTRENNHLSFSQV